ncbi:MAG TPA: F0F1 ATP synthase subunit gamma [Acidimicrobiia bacterium]|jgi:F-type H+-transporting ATPase subunit gamma|nr:F0F1 ATP synthase subunit gamma [Acidimicrobiia bacterium]
MASAQLRDTRRRIRSVEAIKKITRAMELIATSRIPKAQARVNASKPYTAKLIEVIENVGAAGAGAKHRLLEQREVKTVGLVIVTSDRGLAGSYASNIIRLAENRIRELDREGKDVALYAIGKKAQAYFRYRGFRIDGAYLGVTDTPGYGDARAVASSVLTAFATGHIDAVQVFFTRYQSAMNQIPTRLDLLPITPPERAQQEGPSATYEFEPSPEEILDRLLPRYVEATVFNVLLEASASEHSARRRAMKAATDNAEDLIRVLSVQANRARQAEITTAISEIVGGAEALAESSR